MLSKSGIQNAVLLQKIGIGLAVAALFCVARYIQSEFLTVFSIGPRASWFYLPAAVITLGALVSPTASLLGIFMGSLILNTVSPTAETALGVFLVSLVPAAAAGLSLLATAYFNPRFREFHRLQERFSQIDAIDIFYFCSLYAIINVSLSKLLHLFAVESPVSFPPVMVLGMAFGDLSGSFLVFVFLNLMFSLLIRLR